MQKIGNDSLSQRNNRHRDSVGLLTDLRNRIFYDTRPLDQLKHDAKLLFEETKNPVGFELAARKEFNEALKNEKGRHYNNLKQYLDDCIQIVQLNEDPSKLIELLAIRVDLVVRWRMQRVGGSVDWAEFLSDIEAVRTSSKYRDLSLIHI